MGKLMYPMMLSELDTPYMFRILCHSISTIQITLFTIYQEGVAVGRTFASLKDYQVDGNKEMMAIGLMNIVGSCTSCYVTTGTSLNQSLILVSSPFTRIERMISVQKKKDRKDDGLSYLISIRSILSFCCEPQCWLQDCHVKCDHGTDCHGHTVVPHATVCVHTECCSWSNHNCCCDWAH